jgi:omega-amidase
MSLTFTLVQTNLFWEDKKANLFMLQEKILNLQEKTQIVILPEMFSTGFSMQPKLLAEKMDGETIDWMRKIASTKKIILTGSIIIEENDHYYNRLIWMMPNGQMGYYDKRHCFAYGGEDLHYTAGKTKTIAQVNGWKINLQICYDLRFPVWSRQQKNNLFDAIIYVANWPEKRIYAWKSLLVARAIENQCYVIGVNRVGSDGKEIHHNGASMVINPLGEVLYLKENIDDIFTITLDKQELENIRNQFPFWKDADDFLLK